MALLTFAKIYGISNTVQGRQLARDMADTLAEGIRELAPRSTFASSVLFDERCAGEAGFRLKIECNDSSKLAVRLNLPEAGERRGRTAGGRGAFVVNLHGVDPENVTMADLSKIKRRFFASKASYEGGKEVVTPVAQGTTMPVTMIPTGAELPHSELV